MRHNKSTEPKFRRSLLLTIVIVILLSPLLFAGASAPAQASGADNSAETIVLVHGAWADGSGWNEVTARLQADGYKVWVVPNPLRGLSSDAAYVASILQTISGPIVLVAHSY